MLGRPSIRSTSQHNSAFDRRQDRSGLTLVELLVVIAIIGLVIAIFLPAVQSTRESSRRVTCASHMRQLGIAAHLFHDSHGSFPASGWTQPGPGNPAGKYVGWRALLLPFLEQRNLHDFYDFQQHWWEGANLVAAAVPVPIYRCPSSPQDLAVFTAIAKPPRPALTFSNPVATTDYEAIQGVRPESINPHLQRAIYDAGNRRSVMSRNSRTRMADIRDGKTQTIMIIECGGRPQVYRQQRYRSEFSNDQGISWADSEGAFSFDGASHDGSREGCGPAGGCTVAISARNDNEPSSFHHSGAFAAFADGRVSFIAQSVDIVVFSAACTMNAGETEAGMW